MNRARGFTLVELLIVIVIITLLAVLTTVNLRGSQANARDTERKNDVANIVRGLEGYYVNSANNARYPSTSLTSTSQTDDFISDALRDIDIKSLRAPGQSTRSLISATNAIETTTGVQAVNPATGLPASPTIDTYVYQPLQPNNTLCTSAAQECRRFNLFYRLESDLTIYKIMSKYQ